MTEKAKPPVNELYEHALKNYEQALKTGLKLQEEVGKWWSNVATPGEGLQDWQKKVNHMLDDAFPVLQKRMEETLQHVEDNARTSLDLLKQAAEVTQCTTMPESQAKVQKLWQTSLNSLQRNTQAITQANVKMMETWSDFVRKGIEPVAAKGK